MAEPVKLSEDNHISGAWIEGVESPDFKMLVDARKRFIVTMLVVFVVGFVGLSILLSFQRPLMGVKVLGPINLGYFLIFANYAMAWIIAIIYSRVSGRDHDPLIQIVVKNARKNGGK